MQGPLLRVHCATWPRVCNKEFKESIIHLLSIFGNTIFLKSGDTKSSVMTI